jgi:ABC-2 type transport system permease protein
LGKALGLVVALSVVLLPAAIIGAIALFFSAPAATAPDGLARACLMAIGYLIYFAVFILLSLGVSAASQSSRAALVTLFSIWIINCLLLPRVAADLSERLYPTPTGREFWEVIERDLKQGVDGHNPSDQRTEELKRRILQQYGVRRVEDLPVNFSGLVLQAGEEYGNRVFDRRYGELWGLYEKQNRVQTLLALGAPLLAIRPLSMGLAGTDSAQHRDFALAAEGYRRMLNKTMNETLAYNSRGNNSEYKGDAALWKSVADFAYRPPGIGQVARNQAWNFGILLFWLAAVALFAFRAASHLKP